jgi:hypothetical protein
MAVMNPRGPREPERTGPWALPRVLGVEFRPVTYPEPRIYYVGRERRQTSEAVEILVRTAAPLPIRALSPVIFVGERVVADYDEAGPNLYRYLAFDPRTLAPNAPLSLGWPGRPPATRVALDARYRPSSPVA